MGARSFALVPMDSSRVAAYRCCFGAFDVVIVVAAAGAMVLLNVCGHGQPSERLCMPYTNMRPCFSLSRAEPHSSTVIASVTAVSVCVCVCVRVRAYSFARFTLLF